MALEGSCADSTQRALGAECDHLASYYRIDHPDCDVVDFVNDQAPEATGTRVTLFAEQYDWGPTGDDAQRSG
jgi:hypothetical protein